jgi:tetratricopeptide (TPR) repeat protein
MELIEGVPLAAVCERLQSRGCSVRDLDLPTWLEAVSTACAEARQAETSLSDEAKEGRQCAGAADHRRADAARPPERLAGRNYVRDAVELVRQVAEAAHALHERGIVHRDVKPGNILVSPDGTTAVLMDLGLAQVADELGGRVTKTRQFVGTLRYASPEQVLAVGRLDRTSDVYSLGATLCELLTLRPMFNATDETPTPELMRRIQYEEPARLREAHPGIARDLDAIVEKCLQKDARRRYPTAQALANDLADFLGGKPVQVRPVSPWERIWKWAKRRPAAAGMFGVCAGAALFVLATSILYAVHVKAANEQVLAANRDLLTARTGEEAARLRAESRSEMTRNAVDVFYTKVAEEWFADQPHRGNEQRAFLEKALQIYQRLAQEEGAEPGLWRDTGLAYFRVGDIYRELYQVARAEEAYRQALRNQEGLHAESPSNRQYRQDLATTWYWLGELLRSGEGRLAEAEAAYTSALRLQRSLLDDTPRDPRSRREFARSHRSLGIVHMHGGDPAKAEQHLQEAIRILVNMTSETPNEPYCRNDMASCLLSRGVLYKGTGRPAHAEADQRRAVSLYQALALELPHRPMLRFLWAVSLNNLGLVVGESEHPEQAVALHRQAVRLLQKLAEDFAGHADYRSELANTHNSLAAVLAVSPEPVRDWV